MNSRHLIRIPLFALFVSLLSNAPTRAETPAPSSVEATRAAFLKIIDRPRVDLTPEVQLVSTDAGIAKFHFTYASDASNRVAGLLLEKEGFARDGKKHPVVIAAHGTGGKKEGLVNLLKKLAERDFIAVAIDGRFHGERGNNADYNNAIAKAFEQGGAHPLYYDTVWDLMRLIDYVQSRPDVDPLRIGLTGFSKGGIETWMISAVDPRVACAIPCIGVQSFRWAIEWFVKWLQ